MSSSICARILFLAFLSSFHGDLGAKARIWFQAPQRRDLRATKARPCAPGKINAPPPSTSQNILTALFRLFLRRGESFIIQEPDWKKKKRRNAELSRTRVEFWPLFGP